MTFVVNISSYKTISKQNFEQKFGRESKYGKLFCIFPMSIIVFSVQTVIMGADLANSIVQTTVMFAELAESREANRIGKEANKLTERQMRLDMEFTLMQMKQEIDLSDADTKLRRELNSNLLGELSKIANSIHDVEIAIRKCFD